MTQKIYLLLFSAFSIAFNQQKHLLPKAQRAVVFHVFSIFLPLDALLIRELRY